MDSTRRNFVAGAGAAALVAGAAPARALVQDRFQTLMQQVMALTWVGQSRTRSDRFAGGEFVAGIGMKFNLKSDWSYDGAMILMMNLDGQDHRGQFAISGECWTIGDDAGVSIYRCQFIKGTALPAPYGWGTSRSDFRFYNDSNRKGHFTLQGILTGDGDGTQYRVNMIEA